MIFHGKNNDVRRTLVEARRKIKEPTNWLKGCSATRTNNLSTSPLDPLATCFCAVGAVRSAVGPGLEDMFVYTDALEVLGEASGRDSIISFNDDPQTTHADVLDVFDKAIAMCEANNRD